MHFYNHQSSFNFFFVHLSKTGCDVRICHFSSDSGWIIRCLDEQQSLIVQPRERTRGSAQDIAPRRSTPMLLILCTAEFILHVEAGSFILWQCFEIHFQRPCPLAAPRASNEKLVELWQIFPRSFCFCFILKKQKNGM